ncbi:MAG: hypothetical protein GEU78_09735 [Actinobacteria bacterium]|nr:hypothetical protein [Actinomycetota bacterium]
MALGDVYATLEQLKSYLGPINDIVDDDELTDALNSTSRGIEKICHRQFNDAGTASARVYEPSKLDLVRPDDFHTEAGLVVETDDTDDGTFPTAWAATDFQLEPLNGIVDGENGWPFWKIRAVNSHRFPLDGRRATVRVTARWGWATVPSPIKQACLIVAAETFKLKDAPFGVAGYGEFGAVRIRDNPVAMNKLAPYIRDPLSVL